MSFILDALKKSEQERARQQAPVTLELPRGKQRRVTPLWMIVVLALLLVNCALLVYMMWRRPSTPAPELKITQPATTPVAPTAHRPIRSLEEEAGIAANNATTTEDEAVDDWNTVEPPVHGAPLVRAVTPGESSVNLPTGSVSNASPDQPTKSPPTVEALGGFNALGLQELRLDLHVYAANPKDRLVFINGKRYREGEALADGPILSAITPQGVVLSSRGQSFLLPR